MNAPQAMIVRFSDLQDLVVEMAACLEGIESTYVFLDSMTSGLEPENTNVKTALKRIRKVLARARKL